MPSPTRPALPSTEMLPQVFGRYLLLRRLSSGGMGEIFLAKHGLAGFEKICVIKKVLPHLSEDEHFLSRFVDEAQVAIQLQHGNIAQVFEVGRVGDDYFLALEFVEGCDLRRALSRLVEHDQCFPVELALLVARDVATGLSYAHRRKDPTGQPLGLVHCDVSPPNIMISFEGEVKIIDFGIAKSALAGTATDPRMGFGKIGYMAPEQLVRGGRIDARTDIYATGAVLFEMLTGNRLYEPPTGDYRELARRIIRGQHLLPSALDPALAPYDELLRVALHPDAGQRFQSAAALRDAIQAALVQIHPTLSSEQLGSFVRQLFAGERAEMRRLTAHAQGADLKPWQDQLAKPSHPTISFALSPLHTREMQVPPIPARTEDTRLMEAPPAMRAPAGPSDRPRPRRAALWAASAALMFGGGALLATVLASKPGPLPGSATARGTAGEAIERAAPADDQGPGARDPQPDQAPAAPPAEPPAGDVGPGATTAPGAGDDGDGSDLGDDGETASDIIEMPADTLDRRAGDGAQDGDEQDDEGATGGRAEEDAVADTRRDPEPQSRRLSRRSRPRRDRADRAQDQDQGDVSASAVQAKFMSVSREYQRFEQSYGARFEAEWAELAHQAQFAGSDADRLRSLSRALDRFRARMRRAKQ